MNSEPTRFFGKYRGKVTNNVDPMKLGRVQVSCPDVLGEGKLSWAMPCVPYAGNKVGLYTVPPKGANVWVEFEGGDLNYPIVGGCFWGKGQLPANPPVAEIKVFKTEAFELVIKDLKGAGGLTLKMGKPAVAIPITLKADNKGVTLTMQNAKMTLSPKAIELRLPPAALKLYAAKSELKHGAGSVAVQGLKVSLNKGALEVT
ncbi:MAG: phage baseplate assembly protein V [Acidobacteriota bacterium]